MGSRKFANLHSATFLKSISTRPCPCISKLTFKFVERNREIANFYRENTGLNTVKKPEIAKSGKVQPGKIKDSLYTEHFGAYTVSTEFTKSLKIVHTEPFSVLKRAIQIYTEFRVI